MINFDEKPEFIPMLLRTNYTIFDRIRPNILVDVPIIFDKDPDDLDRKDELDIEQEFSKICYQWVLSVVLNRNLIHE